MSANQPNPNLIDRIRNPIAVSLHASNSTDSAGFQDPDKVHTRSFFNARTLDVWTTATAPGYCCEHKVWPAARHLPPEALRPRLYPPRDAQSFVARLLVTSPTLKADGTPRYRDDWWVDQRQLDHLPFVPRSMEALFNTFQLPPKFFWYRLHSYSVGNFYRTTNWDSKTAPRRPKSIGFVLHFPFTLRPARDFRAFTGSVSTLDSWPSNHCKDDPFLWSLALNYTFRERTTQGLLDGLTDHAFNDLYRRALLHGGRWTLHPLHIPIILLQTQIDHAAWDMDAIAGQLSDFEKTVGLQNSPHLDKFDRLTSRLAHLGRDIKFQSELTRFLVDTLKYLDSSMFETQGFYPDNELLLVGQQMKEKLTNFQYLTENYLESCRFLEINTKSTLDYINTRINQQDNQENRRSRKFQDEGLRAQLDDAQSNKAISILTLGFLPPTAVAAIGGLDAFDWQKPSGGKYKPSFGLFWVISIVLTVTVIIIYAIFRRKMKQRKELAVKLLDEWTSSHESVDKSHSESRSAPTPQRPLKVYSQHTKAVSRHRRSQRGRSRKRRESDFV